MFDGDVPMLRVTLIRIIFWDRSLYQWFLSGAGAYFCTLSGADSPSIYLHSAPDQLALVISLYIVKTPLNLKTAECTNKFSMPRELF